jgi:hypothetical protein
MSERMLPVAIDTERRRVGWLDFGSTRFEEPFFDETIQKLTRSGSPQHRVTDLARLIELGRRFPRVVPTGLVFHVSRCGSTLVANALRTAPAATVVAEASTFNAMFLPNALLSREVATGLRYLVRFFAHDDQGRKQKLIIKFSSWNILLISFIRSIWPSARCLIVVRDPVEVMVSNLQRPSWASARMDSPWASMLTGCQPSELREMSREEFCARGLGRFCAAAFAVLDRKCMVVDYSGLNSACLRRIGEFLTIDLADEDRLQELSTVYSKDLDRQAPFEDDSERKRREATAAVRTAARLWVYPSYLQLKKVACAVAQETGSF